MIILGGHPGTDVFLVGEDEACGGGGDKLTTLRE